MKVRQLELTLSREYDNVLPGVDKITRVSQIWEIMKRIGGNVAPAERLWVIPILGRNQPAGVIEVTRGERNCTSFSPRLIFTPVIMADAGAFIMIHNHPPIGADAGDPRPSPEDLKTTNMVKQAGILLEIKLIDHVVIAPDGWETIITKTRCFPAP